MEKIEIRKMVSDILRYFGGYYNPAPYYINGNEEPYVVHKDFGLELRKYIKTGNILIKYNDEIVYDEYDGTYLNGMWEDVLKEYHKKISIILNNKEQARIKQEKCKNIIKTLKKVMYTIDATTEYYALNEAKIVKLDDTMKIIKLDEKNGYNLKKTNIKLFENGNEVFSYIWEECFGNYGWYDSYETYPVYIEGLWEDKLMEIENNYNKDVTEDSKQKTLNYLNELKNL